jgi:ABC-type multidrug transport system fused ATPase/permease subunit
MLSTQVLSVEKFFSYVDQQPAETATSKESADATGAEEWAIDDVSYSYPERKEKALENVSFQIRSKEKVAIVGLNGAGKTTLMKLMLRLRVINVWTSLVDFHPAGSGGGRSGTGED